jgi:hypothetical protein
MIVLVNVKITSHRLSSYNNGIRGGYPSNDRMDIFKYMLSSYSIMSDIVSKYIFYIEISDEYNHRKSELESYIEQTFDKDKLIVNWYRNNYITEWRNVYNDINKINDDIIWFACNDDHIFIDNSLDIINDGIEILKNDKDELSSIYYSHWIEGIRIANHYGGELTESGNYVKFKWGVYDGILIIKKERFRRYWFDYEDVGQIWYRTDGFLSIREQMITNFYVPTKEIVRHFDGYGHVGDFSNNCPQLVIPSGFFENDLKIKYGYKERYDNYININPMAEYLFSVDINGSDYRWSLNDIPLFWKDKIKDIDININIDKEKMKEFRNYNYLLSSKLCKTSYGINFTSEPPIEWFHKNIEK